MIHTWHCKKCNAPFETACYSFTIKDGKTIFLHNLSEYRKRVHSAGLCDSCFIEIKKNPNPILDILFALEEKRLELEKIIQELRIPYEDSLDKTPERIEALKIEEKWREKFRADIKDSLQDTSTL